VIADELQDRLFILRQVGEPHPVFPPRDLPEQGPTARALSTLDRLPDQATVKSHGARGEHKMARILA
jgi:hypothetical protein